MTTASTNSQFGVNLWWTIPELTLPAEQARALLVAHGFEKDDMREPSDRLEVARAVRSFQNRRTKQDRRLAEVASEQGDSVVYGILDRKVTGDEVAFEQQTTVKYDKNTNTVNVTGALVAEVEVALAEYKDKVTDSDVREFLRRLVRMCHGIAKRPTGGIYFIPAQFAGVIDSAKSFLHELNAGAKLYVERVVDDTEARQNVWEAVETNLDEQLTDILNAVERVEKRIGCLKNQTDRIEELRGLMKTYQDLLGQEAKYEDMAEKLDVAVQKVAEKMAKLQEVEVDKVEKFDGFFDAAKAVLASASKALTADEIERKVKAGGFKGEVPARVRTHLSWRVKRGQVRQDGDKYLAA